MSTFQQHTEKKRILVKLHYLGHASFILQFENGVSVLTDYGVSQAYGLDSPIFDFTGFQPDIVTYSHNHPDHNRGTIFDKATVLSGTVDFCTKELDIKSIPSCETTLSASDDNSSFLFTYDDMKILHLGDAQALIENIEDKIVEKHILDLYPDTYDLLMMTIQGVNQFIPQAEAFIDLLKPACVIPMHYWSKEYKQKFLGYLRQQNEFTANQYCLHEIGQATYAFGPIVKRSDYIHVISLEPAPYT